MENRPIPVSKKGKEKKGPNMGMLLGLGAGAGVLWWMLSKKPGLPPPPPPPPPTEKGNLYGQVTNLTGTPLVDVYVYADSGVAIPVRVTDANGNYTFSSIESGTYTVTFRKTGYYDVIKTSISLAADSNYLLNVQMTPIVAPPPPPPTGKHILLDGLEIVNIDGYSFAETGYLTQTIVDPFTGGAPQTKTIPYGKLVQPIPKSMNGQLMLAWHNNSITFSGHAPDVASLQLGVFLYPDPEIPSGFTYLQGNGTYSPLQNLGQTIGPPFDAVFLLNYSPRIPPVPTGVYNALIRIWALAWAGNYVVDTFWIRNAVAIG